MKPILRLAAVLALFFVCRPLFASQMGEADFTKAETRIIPVRGNISLIEIRVPQDLFHIAVLSGPGGYLLVDHPEALSNPIVQKALDDLGKRPVKFLLNTHWHYDHVGGNEIYGPDTVIVAQENVRKRLMTKQMPSWSPTPIGPYPERAWPRITFRDSLTIHFDGEDIEMDHYANGHTDGDSVVYFAQANVVAVGDLFDSKGGLAGGVDMEGMARSLSAVLERMNDETIVITGHSQLSSRRDLAQYVTLLNETIAHVRQELSAGKSEKEIVDEGLPEIWKPWFAPRALPNLLVEATGSRLTMTDLELSIRTSGRDFMQQIYETLTHTSNPDQ